MRRFLPVLLALVLCACKQDISIVGSAECNGALDPGEDAVDSPFDVDGDGAFDASNPGCRETYNDIDLDCDDDDPEINPQADEVVCTDVDEDCDADTPDRPDGDDDGVDVCADCDDANPAVSEAAPELCDGLDNDCNGAADFDPAGEIDGDGDGLLSCEDCDDGDAGIGAPEPEVCDGLDNDCNGVADFDLAGEIDSDADGALSCEDCDDADAMVYPGADELCDGLDNDCNGVADFDLAGEVDADADGARSCIDCDDGDGNNAPSPWGNEICDGLDNDCNTLADFPGETTDNDGDGYPACVDCDDTDPSSSTGTPEVCDYLDNDCDGAVDEREAVCPAVYDPNLDLDSDGTPDACENILMNGGFDAPNQACPWEAGPFALTDWSPDDRLGDPASGGLLTSSDNPGSETGSFYCIEDLLPGDSFLFSAWGYDPEATSVATGFDRLGYIYWPRAGCTGSPLVSFGYSSMNTANSAWFYLEVDIPPAPAGAISLSVRINTTCCASGTNPPHDTVWDDLMVIRTD